VKNVSLGMFDCVRDDNIDTDLREICVKIFYFVSEYRENSNTSFAF